VFVLLTIIILAALRSPFLPSAYATFPATWLLTLMAASVNPSTRGLIVTLATWVLLTLYIPMSWLSPRVLALAMLLPQITMIALPFVLLKRLKSAAPTLSAESPRLQPTPA